MTHRQNIRGFTLIELLIAVAVVGILSAIAIPSYQDFVRRGKIPEATNGLSEIRRQLEQRFQDTVPHRFDNYVDAACVPPAGVAPFVVPRYFTYDCSLVVAGGFTITATGNAAQNMAGYVYTLNNLGQRTSTLPDGTTGACWLTKAGQTCTTGF